MERLVPLIVVFAILAALLVLKRRRERTERDAPIVYERRHLFTAVERSFLGVLDRATGDRARVFGKVRLDDLLEVPDVERRTARPRWASERVDFVVCDASDLRVMLVVELDDASQDGRRAEERGASIDAALTSAGIRVLRFAARSGHTVDEVRRRLEPDMPVVAPAASSARHAKPGKGGSAGRRRASAGRPADAPPVKTAMDTTSGAAARTAPTPATVATDHEAATAARLAAAGGERGSIARLGSCPTCGRPMVERVGKRGALKGKPFLVCSGDPPCVTVGADG